METSLDLGPALGRGGLASGFTVKPEAKPQHTGKIAQSRPRANDGQELVGAIARGEVSGKGQHATLPQRTHRRGTRVGLVVGRVLSRARYQELGPGKARV